MAEDEDKNQSAADALTDGEGDERSLKIRVLIPVGVVLFSAAAGFLATRLIGGSPSSAQASAGEEALTPPQNNDSGDYVYFPLEPIIVNLNEPRLARYIRATLILVFNKDESEDAIEIVTKKLPTIRSRLILYLSNCSLEDVRGAEKLNGILRDIQDSANDWLWPNGKPLIVRVDYSEWAVQ